MQVQCKIIPHRYIHVTINIFKYLKNKLSILPSTKIEKLYCRDLVEHQTFLRFSPFKIFYIKDMNSYVSRNVLIK